MYFRYGDPGWDAGDALEGAGRVTAARAGGGGGAAAGQANGAGETASGRGVAGRRFPTVDLRGVRVHAVTEADCVDHVMSELDAGRGGMVVTPNLDHLHRCLHDLTFAALVSEAELVVADGMPLVWAARLQGTPLPERVAGSNLISSLSGAAAARGRRVFFLGGAPSTAEGAAQVLRERFPSLKVVGTACPPLGFETDPAAMADVIQAVSSARPDIIFVALGSPKQERLIVRLRPLLPQAWWLGVGISFSFLCGDVRRAPQWMQKTGLEWIHRLFQEPRRLFHRYIIVGVPFATNLLAKALLAGLPGGLGGKRRLATEPVATPGSTPGSNGHHGGSGHPNGNGKAATSPAAPALNRGPGVLPTVLPQAVPALALPASGKLETPMPAATFDGANAANPLQRLRALVLLGGSVRPTALGLCTSRAVLDLPLDGKGSVLTGWLDQAADLARAVGIDKLPVRVMVNHKSPEPVSADPRHYGAFRVERDLSEYRGTGGVLRDLANDYADDDLIVVANAAQILLEPLPSIVAELEKTGGDVSVVSHEDGTPSGIMLVACKTLRLIAEGGYVDMKEQALPQIATQFDVRVLSRRRPTGLSIRTLEDYIHALRYHHRRSAARLLAGGTAATATAGTAAAGTGVDAMAEDWSPLFSLVEAGATVDPSARIHDSVVLEGGVVEAGAVLVRSVVCPGGVLRRDRTAMETMVTADDSASKSSGRNGKGGKTRASAFEAAPVTAPIPAGVAAAMSPAAAAKTVS